MAARPMKYNPSFLTDQELIDTFVVRHSDLATIMETIAENQPPTNQHLLIIGARGSGKTTLVLRAAAEVRRDEELSKLWYPLVFGEDSYEVASAGEFWLEAINYLAIQTGDGNWQKVHAELLRDPDEESLRRRALAALMDFADRENKRILLVVENLNMILGEQLSEDDAWSLRHTLQGEPRLMLLGTATTRFKEIENSGHALYEHFKLHDLAPLTETECIEVWKMITGRDLPPNQARPIRILTGGSPRLLSILSSFGANKSFHYLMKNLTLLVDDHTDYFKSNMENLPAAERKVFACLAGLWEEATAKQVAEAARLTTSQASAQLNRLVNRGIVSVVSSKPRKKTYQLAERLYNIYYLMRRGQDQERVRAVVSFMVQFYGRENLHEMAADIAREACAGDHEQRRVCFMALDELINRPEAEDKLVRIGWSLPDEIFNLPEMPTSLAILRFPTLKEKLEIDPHNLEKILNTINSTLDNNSNLSSAIKSLKLLLDFVPNEVRLMDLLGLALANSIGHEEESEIYFKKALTIEPNSSTIIMHFAHLLTMKLNKPKEAETLLRKAIKTNPNFAPNYSLLGFILSKNPNNYKESNRLLSMAIKLEPNNRENWMRLLICNIFTKNHEKFIQNANKYLKMNNYSSNSLEMTAHTALFSENVSLWRLAEKWSRDAMNKNPKNPFHHGTLCISLSYLGITQQALSELSIILKHPNILKTNSRILFEALLAIAAAGGAKEALDLIEKSPSAPYLEPLIVGLKMYLGLEAPAPQEVKEVAQDVVKRIHGWEERFAKTPREE